MYYELLKTEGFIKEEDKEPEGIECYEYYLEAFWELSTCRDIGMGEGPIPFTAIVEYARAIGEGDLQTFWGLIRRMDRAYLGVQSDKRERESKRVKTK